MADKNAIVAPLEARREEEMQIVDPSQEPLSQYEDYLTVDEEPIQGQPTVIKALRTQAKTQTTKLVKKIVKAIDSRSSRSIVKELRSQLVERLQECTELNDELAWAGSQSGAASADHLRWIAEVETSVNSCYLAIDEYFRQRAGSSASTVESVASSLRSHVSRGSSRSFQFSRLQEVRQATVASVAPSLRSHVSRGSSRTSQSSRLQEVRQERRFTELELNQLRRNAQEEADEEKRLRELEMERRNLLKMRKQRELRDLIEKQRTEEQILVTSLDPAPDTQPSPDASIPPPVLSSQTVGNLGGGSSMPVTSQQPIVTSSIPLSIPSSANYPIVAPPVTPNEAWIYSLGMTSGSHPPSHGSRVAQMQKIDIMHFSGDPKEWPLFISTFKSMVHDVLDTDDQRMAALRQLLEPKVRKSVAGALNNPVLYRRALEKLHRKYGHPHKVTKACLHSVLKHPKVKERDFEALEAFSEDLHNAVDILIASGHDNELKSTALIEQLKDKLSPTLLNQWGEEIEKLQPRSPNLLDFDSWLETKVAAASHVRPIPDADDPDEDTKDHKAKTKRGAPKPKGRGKTPRELNVLATGREVRPECLYCKKPEHDVTVCKSFAALPIGERASQAKEKGLCFRCLGGGHLAKDCTTKAACGETGCTAKHHSLLHRPPRYSKKGEAKKPAASDREPIAVNNISCYKSEDPSPETKRRKVSLLCVVPVQLRANGRSFNTFALLDPGSDGTLIRQDVARKLRLKGPMEETEFTTFKGSDPKIVTQTVHFRIASLDGRNVFPAEEATAVPELVSTFRKRNISHLKQTWPHLRDIPLDEAEPGEVTVFIGTDVPEALDYEEVRKPPPGIRGPRALLTPFGWSLRGPVQVQSVGPGKRNIMNITFDDLHESVKSFWETESLGVQPQRRKMVSEADELALKTLEATVRSVGERYEAGLLWSSATLTLPDNRKTALRRFFALERKLNLNSELAALYVQTIEAYVADGHARKLNPSELRQTHPRVWYLPHHAVTNPNKPGKVRVVFDAAAETGGVSLNSALLAGPDLLNNLLGVLLRFREYPVAVSADIKSMFHQVQVIPADRPALRFLWRAPGAETPPETFEMTVQIFGAKSSPTVCNYTLRKAAQDKSNEFPHVEPRVERNFYMDDYLDSIPTEEAAISICRDLKEVLIRGGFPLAKWKSSSRTVLASFPAEDRANPDIDLDLDRLPVERTLGVWWNAETDSFTFRAKRMPFKPTKREILRIVASVFDPIGFLIPITLTAKTLLQELWRLELQWDENIPEHLSERWRCWLDDLRKLETITIPRCLQPDLNPSTVELHICADASEIAFGAVAYLRVAHGNDVTVNFVTAKSRVAPLRQLTIPRLELQGALLAARMAHTISSELRLKIDEVYLWTDSTTVLNWIRSKTCRYKTFVANRVTEILELTEPNQWRHIPGKLNPADDCSRGLEATSLATPNRWFNGPTFLQQPSSAWPAEQIQREPDNTDPEILPPLIASVGVDKDESLEVLRGTSNLNSLKRILAWTLRFTRNTRPSKFSVEKGSLTVPECSDALLKFITVEQKRLMGLDYAALEKKEPLPRNSKLLKLTPFLDERSIMRVGGRIQHADVPSNVKHPILLSPDSPLTALLIRHTHERLAHGSTERTLADLRLQYWVIGGRAAVDKIVNGCFACNRYRAKPYVPLMAALPRQRLDAYSPPFTNVGVDYFGPLAVVIHRRVHKRYVCLFTCLVTRAVHLEVAHTLDTDSFILAFRRFVSRRGAPAHVFSDNGTNLSAGEKELRQNLKAWNEKRIAGELAQREISWHFSPPASPHFGGVWERLVRSAKVALRYTLRSQTVTDEILATVMAEVESLLNGRPLTHLSMNPEDPEPLTPSHFLLGRANPNLPIGLVTDEDLNARKRWRTSQAITERFWRRWLREYVPSVIERRKWVRPNRNLQPDDVVLLIEENSPRGLWPLARVIQVYPGPDGLVRTALVKTKHGQYVRPVAKLCLMEIAEPED